MKMNLQIRRNNLGMRERFQWSYPRGMFNPLGITDEFLFRNNFNDQKMHFIRTRKIFPHSREAFPCRVTFIWQRQFTAVVEWTEISLWEKILEFDCPVRFEFLLRIFPKHEASCVYLAMIQEIPQQARWRLRPKPKSSGLEIEANLDFQD